MELFKLASFGESHGPGIGCVVEGCPSGLELSELDIQKELDKRRPGQNPASTERSEEDKVEIISGVYEGKTLGTPIALLIRNKDADSSSYEKIKNIPRPGHADYCWREKFSWVDHRGGGRSSGRETAARVAAGAIAKKLLQIHGVELIAYAREIGGVVCEAGIQDPSDARNRIDKSPVRALGRGEEMLSKILEAKKEKDSLGGIIELWVDGVPPGLGEPVFDKLDADLAKAIVSIPGVKGVEFGAGFKLAGMLGSEANDSFAVMAGKVVTESNNAGGIQGGLSNGMPIVLRAAVKPTSSIGIKQKSVDLSTLGEAEIEVCGRHDPCIVPRAVPVVEAMAAVVLADHMLLSGFIPRKLPVL